VEFAATLLPDWGPLAVADINRDGCIDILGAVGDCNGHFQGASAYAIGLEAIFSSGRAYRDVRFADFNGDGILDAVANTYTCDVAACGGNSSNSQLQLYFGNADGTFTQDLSFTGLSLPGGGFGETIVIADFNNDGYLDIFLPKYTYYDPSEHNFLLINDGSGHFIDAADTAGVAMRNVPVCGRPEGAQAADINNDGRIDLYAGSHLFLNNGNNADGIPVFADLGPTIDVHCDVVTPSSAGLPAFFDEGAKFVDLDNSGQLSLALNGESTPPGIRVLKFDGIAHFSDADVIPPMFLSAAWGFNAADVDGDGLSDLVVAGGCDSGFFNGGEIDPDCTTFGNPHALPQLLVNRGGHFVLHDFFDDGLQPTGRGWHDLLTYADFDYSGTVDFIARVAGGTNTGLYTVMNRAVSFDTLTVTVLGANGEQNQAGRVVRVSPVLRPGVVMTQVVDGGSGYMSNGPYDLTFATPYEGAYTVTVRFAAGSYVTTAHAGDHVTMRANGTYSLE
ncbi:MAG TPA: VCBS repeat-containing protein, partial [Rudaea sp.]|nr:VCBS repeat-containing protein [Rudaea sp.]